jgi:predicted nuclease with TOPRIM domain
MASPLPEDFQREFNTVRNKQIEVFDRIAELEGRIRQFTERMGKLEDVVARLESNSQRKQPHQR